MATITERNGGYLIMVSEGYGTDGRQKRKLMTWRPEVGMTKRQVKEELNIQAALFERRVRTGKVLDGHVTFAEFVERWRSDYAEPSLAPKTLVRYEELLRRILPAIGHIRLDKLQPHQLMAFYSSLQNMENQSGVSFKATHRLISAFEKSGLTRQALADEAECHVNTIYRLVRGQGVDIRIAQEACDILGIPFSEGIESSRPMHQLAGKTINHHHRLISSILNQAVFWQVIPENPTRRVKPPKVERKEAKYLDEEQTVTLLHLLDNEPHQNQVMIRFFLLSGVRRGELCGLEWKDIDFKNSMITVCRTSQYLPEKGVFTKGTKTDSSVRTIKLPDQAFELLKEHRKWQRKKRIAMGDRWVDSDRLFAQDDGTPVHPDSITGWFHDFISRTDLPQISIHSLRHTNITLLLAAGIPLRTVSYRAGHAQTSTTSNIYSHAIRTADEKAAEVLKGIISSCPKN
jgi:integrase